MLRMLADRVAVIPIEDPDRTEAGLYIPKEAKRRSDQGIIKYRGEDVKELRVGDHVLFSAYTGDRLEVEGEGKFVILKEVDVVALLTNEPAHAFYTREQVEDFVIKAISSAELKTADPMIGIDSSLILEHFRAQLDAYETVRAE